MQNFEEENENSKLENNENFEKKEEIKELQETKISTTKYIFAWVKTFPITAIVMLISIVLFILVFSFSKINKESTALTILYLGGGVPPLYWNGEVWRLFVNIFHHGNIIHIFFNLYWIYYFGSLTEKFLGKSKYIYFIISCGFFQGIICTLTTEPFAIGLSGLIYAFFGLFLIIRNQDEMIKYFVNPSLIKFLLIFLFLCIPINLLGLLNIAYVAHFAGLIYGLIFGFVFYTKPHILKKIGFYALNLMILLSLFYLYKPIYNPEWQEWNNSNSVDYHRES